MAEWVKAWHQGPGFSLQDLCGQEKEQIAATCPMSSTSELWRGHMYTPTYEHTCTK